jgi:hypothetical protein
MTAITRLAPRVLVIEFDASETLEVARAWQSGCETLSPRVRATTVTRTSMLPCFRPPKSSLSSTCPRRKSGGQWLRR